MQGDNGSHTQSSGCGCHSLWISLAENDPRAHVRDLSELPPLQQEPCSLTSSADNSEGIHVHNLSDFSDINDFCVNLFAYRDSSRESPKRLDWTPSILAPFDDCGTPDELPREYLSAVQLSNATHRPLSYVRRVKGTQPPEEPNDPNDIIRRFSTGGSCLYEQNSGPAFKTTASPPLAHNHEPNHPEGGWNAPKGLRFLLNILAPTVTPTVIGMAPNNIIAECFDYLYTAWITVVAALDSSRRIRRQWWYYRNDGVDTPAWWLGRYGPAKLQTLANALTMACARMTGGIYYNQLQPDLTYVVDMTTGSCSTFYNDCEVVGNELRVCKNFEFYQEEEQKIRLMAALLVTGVTTNRGDLTEETGHYDDDEIGAELIKNAYNIANWVRRRFSAHGWQTRSPNIFWDIRPDKSYLPLFQARMPRVYHVWPKKDSDHTQLRRAWDHSWCYAEAALRFLYKLTYMTEEQIIDMWNFGADADPDSIPRFFLGERQREVIEDPTRQIPPVPWSTDETVPSMRNFFGVYSRERFLLVYRVVLCLCLRYENNYDRGATHLTQKFRLYPGNGNSYGALSFPTGEVDLHKAWFDGDDEYRASTINHELMHYLIRWDDGGRPRDWKSPDLCSTTDGAKCYSIEECLALAESNDVRCRSNNNNYAYWFWYRWRRWGGDWPPEFDAGPGETWHNDPFTDANWENHTYASVVEIGWERLDVMEDRWELWGYMPWD